MDVEKVLDRVLEKTKKQKQPPLWRQLVGKLDKVDAIIEAGGTYRELAEGFGVSQNSLRVAIKKAREYEAAQIQAVEKKKHQAQKVKKPALSSSSSLIKEF